MSSTEQTYTIEISGSDEVSVATEGWGPHSMGPWTLFRFVFSQTLAALKSGKKVTFEVKDE